MIALQPYLLEGWEQAKSLGLAVLVHVLAALLIVLGTMDWKRHRPPQITGMKIEAVMVDTQVLIDKREEAIREAEAARQQEQRRIQREQELAAQQERDRIARQKAAAEAEEAKRQEAQRQRVEAERKREAEMKLQELRQRQARERQAELDRQAAEMEKIRQQREAAEKERRIEEERMKQLEARKQAEAQAQQRAREEAAMQQRMAEEQAAVRAGQLAGLKEQYISAITVQVTNNWLRPPTAQPGLRCTISIVQIPGGEVISATIRGRCNGDEATRRSLVAAVERAGSLPYRGFEDVFEREIDFIFLYDGD